MNWLKKMVVCFFCVLAIAGCGTGSIKKSNEQMYQSLTEDGWVEVSDENAIVLVKEDACFLKIIGNIPYLEIGDEVMLYSDGDSAIYYYENKKMINIDTDKEDDKATGSVKKILQKYDMSIDDMDEVLRWRCKTVFEDSSKKSEEEKE